MSMAMRLEVDVGEKELCGQCCVLGRAAPRPEPVPENLAGSEPIKGLENLCLFPRVDRLGSALFHSSRI
jgi:hypothetical protein